MGFRSAPTPYEAGHHGPAEMRAETEQVRGKDSSLTKEVELKAKRKMNSCNFANNALYDFIKKRKNKLWRWSSIHEQFSKS